MSESGGGDICFTPFGLDAELIHRLSLPAGDTTRLLTASTKACPSSSQPRLHAALLCHTQLYRRGHIILLRTVFYLLMCFFYYDILSLIHA